MLGYYLLTSGVLSQDQLKAVEARRTVVGGHLVESLQALNLIQPEELQSFLRQPPQVPLRLEDTGLEEQFLLNLVLKALFITQLQTVPPLADLLKLSQGIVDRLLQTLKKQALVEVPGVSDPGLLLLRHILSERGRERALAALAQSQYVGPAPVSVSEYNRQVEKQSVSLEVIDAGKLRQALSMLVLPDDLITRLGEAMCAGQAILLYGPPGNGKSSVAQALGHVFADDIYIPYAIEIDGQIVKVFDPAIHEEAEAKAQREGQRSTGLVQYAHDPRWVLCRRPTVISGGELTLGMLDLEFDEISNYYEAPLQVKATGGVLVIDDFGRQRLQPSELLNRWIVPLDKRVDYLTLHTGKKFQIAFDEIVIFSTNLPPRDLMDDALLRRVHYKLRLDPPNLERYGLILDQVVRANGLSIPEDVRTLILEQLYGRQGIPVAAFHPRFIVEQVLSASKFHKSPPVLNKQAIMRAVENLLVE